MIQRNVNLFFQQEHEAWGRGGQGIPCPSVEIKTNSDETILITKSVRHKRDVYFIKSEITRVVPLLAVQFVNTDTFDKKDNIYEYLCIDSTVVFTLVSINKKNNINSFLHFFDGYTGYESVECRTFAYFEKVYPKYLAQYRKNLPYVMKRIKQCQPDLIMTTHFGNENIGRFLFVKNSEIYYYDVVNDTSVELNTYIKQNYSLAQISSFNKKCIPYIYCNMGSLVAPDNLHNSPIDFCE